MSEPVLNEASVDKVRYMSTTAAYDKWAEVYDSDGNFLQALDTIEMKTLLPQFLALIDFPQPWKLVDLGCGTGRNLLPLVRVPNANVIGLEPSDNMRLIAQSRVDQEKQSGADEVATVDLISYDMIEQPDAPTVARAAHGLISTLVLEHIPLDVFFQSASQVLRQDGMFLVTNMHSNMGDISQAGFRVPQTGEKIRPLSYSHSVVDVIQAARNHGFQVEGSPVERRVDDSNCHLLGKRAEKWRGVFVWFGMIFRKTGSLN